jgi:hypothetical protein
MAKPIPGKLNPAHDAAVRRMLATAPQPKRTVKKVVNKRRPSGLRLSDDATFPTATVAAGVSTRSINIMV